MALRKDLGLKSGLANSHLAIALFWGALWGLSEATVGCLLHEVRIPGLAGFVMFPMGILFMLKAYQELKRLSMIFTTAVVAAAIKLSDLILPGTYALDVFRPAMAIICESLVIIALLSITENEAFQRDLIQQ